MGSFLAIAPFLQDAFSAGNGGRAGVNARALALATAPTLAVYLAEAAQGHL